MNPTKARKGATNPLDPEPGADEATVDVAAAIPWAVLAPGRDEIALDETRVELEDDEGELEVAVPLEIAIAVERETTVAGASGEGVARGTVPDVEDPVILRASNRSVLDTRSIHLDRGGARYRWGRTQQ